MTPTCKSVRERNLQRLNPDFADALRRRPVPARCPRSRWLPLRNLADLMQRSPRMFRRRSRRRGAYFAFFLEVFLLAVLRADFFAADFVFDFAFFAILPS